MQLVVTRSYPPEIGGMQNLMWGLTKTLSKHDLIKDKCERKADLILILRMLNLFETKISLKILDNLLPSAEKYCIATLRYNHKYSFIENKIHIHPLDSFINKRLMEK